MNTPRLIITGFRAPPGSLQSLLNTHKSTLPPTLRPKPYTSLKPPQTRPRLFSSCTPPRFSPTVQRKLRRAVAPSIAATWAYSLAWFLDIPPHQFLYNLLFEQTDNPNVPYPAQYKLDSVALPAELDFGNEHFFELLSRARPLKYGHHLREAQESIRRTRETVEKLEGTLQSTRCACKSPHDRERRQEMKEVLWEERESLRLHRERWVKLWVLDQKEGGWAYRNRRRTVEGVVREWMGWDLEGTVVELVRMGFIKV